MTQAKARAMQLYTRFEQLIVIALLIMLGTTILWATGILALDIGGTIAARLAGGGPADEAHVSEFLSRLSVLREVFGGFLLILIGVELMKTVVMYLDQSVLHVEVVFTVALIAVARHAMDIDPKDTPPMAMLGVAAVILALALGYFYFSKTLAKEKH